MDVVEAYVKWGANGYRLPTEAEWEKAARGGLVGKTYPWGDETLDASRADYNSGSAVSVGLYAPNGFGLYDMAGNVFQWVWDWEAADYSAASAADPHGPALSDGVYCATTLCRVRRGGSYAYGGQYLRVFERMFRLTTYQAPYFGFRAASSQP